MKIAEEILQEKSKNIISLPSDTTIYDALQKMLHHRIGAILVKDKGQLVGIWTERELMYDVLLVDFDIKQARIGDYMSTCLLSAPHTDTCYELMDKFLGMKLRYLLIEKDSQYIGMLSSGDVMKETLQEKAREYEDLNFEVSWQYYENWRTPLFKTTPEVNNLYLPYPANIQSRWSL